MTKESHRVIGIIPARLGSSRFPNKVLAPILGKAMIQYVWEAAQKSSALNETLIASEDPEVIETAQRFGAKTVLTPNHFQSGTERVAWASRETDADIIVNLQADEPLLQSSAIDLLVHGLIDSDCDFATLVVPMSGEAELNDPNIVKAVATTQKRALYFSRQPIACDLDGHFLKHIGIYAYRKKALLQFCEWPPSPLEQRERLEQLRALENGMSAKLIWVDSDTVSVDRPEDIAKVESRLLRKGSTR